MAYTKLFRDILTSSIWMEDNETLRVWITMLAMCDQHGEVMASVPGLAHTARLPRDATEKALQILSSPDPDSRSPEYDGRRIVKVDGGWALLNHSKYREKMSQDDRRERDRKRKAAARALKRQENAGAVRTASANVRECPQMSAVSAHTDTDTDTDTEAEEEKISSPTETHPDKSGDRIDWGAVVKQWNTMSPWKKTLAPSLRRKEKFRTRMKEPAFREAWEGDGFATLIAASRSFLTGKGWWGFGWILNEENYLKLLEGNYRDKTTGLGGKNGLSFEYDGSGRTPEAIAWDERNNKGTA